MATPTEWLNEFQVNTGTANTPATSDPHIVGLSNGNFLVAWTESGTTGVATQAGTDIVGKIYDAEGNVVRDSYRINTVSTEDDELDFDIAATNDGGFVIVYRENESANQTDLNFQRHNSAGNVAASSRIVTENVAADALFNPQISFNNVSGTSLITYTFSDNGDENILGLRVDSTATVTAGPYQAAQNSVDDDRDGDVAVLENANVVSVYEEIDGTDVSVEFRIHTPAGAQVVSATTVTSGGTDLDPQVTALAGGGFVVTWEASDAFNGNIEYRIYDSAGASVAGPFTASGSSNPNIQNEPEIVALPDGDFVILWDDDTSDDLIGQRFNGSNGTFDGGQFIIENVNTTTPNIGVTGDGRLLFTWSQGSNVFASIWDPRPVTIDGDDYNQGVRNFVDSNVFTSRTTSSTVNGTTDDDVILGQGGNDTLRGDNGDDIITGGNGNDTIQGGFGDDDLDGEGGIDTVDYSYDPVPPPLTLAGTRTIDLAAGTSFLAPIFIGGTNTDVDMLSGFENVVGSGHRDIITGTIGANVISGGGGSDLINAGAGTDTVNGNDGNDTFTDDQLAGPGDIDTYNGGAGTDTVVYTNTSLTGAVTINLITNEQTLTGGFLRDTYSSIENVSVAGQERVIGNNNANVITGTGITANNIFDGGGGDDTINAGGGNDAINAGLGVDVVDGGTGNDTITDTGSFSLSDADSYDGGTGTDTFIHIDSWNSGVTFDLLAGEATFAGTTYDTFTNIENITVGGSARVIGSNVANVLTIDDFGGNSDNILEGNGGNDTLNAGIGSDILNGGTGADILNGGSGIDAASYEDSSVGVVARLDSPGANTGEATGDVYNSIENLIGSEFNDSLFGDGNVNKLFGLGGIDNMFGRAGDDELQGGNGNDVLFGGAGGDVLNGGSGIDIVSYNETGTGLKADLLNAAVNTGIAAGDSYISIENITATQQNDDIRGDNGNNQLTGLGGDDFLTGRGGNDSLLGVNGNDVLVGGAGGDFLNGGNGVDAASYLDSSSGLTADLQVSGNNTGIAAGDTYQLIEALIGSNFADDFRGDAGNNRIEGRNGDDFLIGRDGDDDLRGDGGNDVLLGGNGADRHEGGAGIDTASYTTTNIGMVIDLIANGLNTGIAAGDGYDSIENLVGSNGTDDVRGDNAANRLEGRTGDDFLFGRGGNDTMLGGSGNDNLRGGTGGDLLNGGSGIDAANYIDSAGLRVDLQNAGVNNGLAAGDTYVSIENLFGSNGADDLRGNAAGNFIVGRDGNDFITGRDGDDDLRGGNGNDVIRGNAGLDVLTGNAGDDSFRFDLLSDGADTIRDFQINRDTILLNNGGGGFTALSNGSLSAANFHVGASAADLNDFIIYDSTTGNLFYDADGSAAGVAIQFANLQNIAAIDENDFLVI